MYKDDTIVTCSYGRAGAETCMPLINGESLKQSPQAYIKATL